jgi:putative methionine-R-sulfoxide reductase with GAF domain
MPGMRRAKDILFAIGFVLLFLSFAGARASQPYAKIVTDWGAVAGLAVIVAGVVVFWLFKFSEKPASRQPGDEKRPARKRSGTWIITAIQVVLVIVGFAGATFHAFPVRTNGTPQDWPILDLTTLAWLMPVVVAFLLPNISEIAWGGFSIKVRELARASDEYEKSLDNLANLAQNWSTSGAMYIAKMRQSDSELLETKENIYRDYIRDRIGEAYEMLATKPEEILRLGLWLYDPVEKAIVFVRGFQLEPKVARYAPGEGMIGKSFTEDRTFNEADVRSVPAYKSSRDSDDPPYRAVLCQPVRWDHKPIGMITVDRSTVGFFDYVSLQVAKGLASQCALALKVYQTRNVSGS